MKMGYIGLGINKVGKPTLPKIILPLKENEKAIPEIITPTFERTTTATYKDGNGIVRGASIDEPRFEGVGIALPEGKGNDGTVSGGVIVTKRGVTGNIGTVSGGVTIDDGAMVFDGSGGVNINSKFGYSTESDLPITINMFFNLNDLSSTNGLIDLGTQSGGYYGIFSFVNTGGALVTRLGNGGSGLSSGTRRKQSANGVISTNTDYMFTLVANAHNNFDLYLNGVNLNLGLLDNGGSLVFGSGGLNIGKILLFNTNLYSNGSINQTLIFNRALTQSEITEIYNAGKDSLSPIRNGLVAEYSGQYYDGTPQAPTKIWDTSFDDGAMVFDDGYRVDINSPIQLSHTQSFTICLQTNISSGNTSNSNLFSSRPANLRGVGLGYSAASSNIQYVMRQDTPIIINSASVDINQDLYIAATFNSNNQLMELFVNGVSHGTITNTNTMLTQLETSIGGNKIIAGVATSFKGQIKNLRIFSRVLTQAEITEIYNAGKDAYSPIRDGLVAEYSGKYYEGLPLTPQKIIDTAKADFEVMFDGDGYLSESQRTNLFLNSTAPVTRTITVSNSTIYTISCKGSGSIALSGAGTGTVTQETPITITTSSTSLTCTVTGILNYAQVEAGGFPTSYIVTEGSAVTRTADNLEYAVGSKITQGQGTLYAQFDCFGIDTSNTIFELVDDNNNKINISLVETTNLLKLLIKKSAQTDLEITSSAITFNQKNKLAVTYADNLISFFLNGVKVGDNTNRTIPDNLQNLIIGAFNGRIKHIKYYKEPISDIKAIAMTQVS